MGKEIQPQAERGKTLINEVMVCQIRALIREMWPDEFDVKPKLTLIEALEERHGNAE